MSPKKEYEACRTGGEFCIYYAKEFFSQIGHISKARFKEIKQFFFAFFHDIKTGSKTRKLAATFAFALVFWWAIYLPVANINEWLYYHYRVIRLTYAEYPPLLDSDLQRSIKIFAEQYSASFGTDCEWFRNHDTDIDMWRNWKHLYRDPYPCVEFNKYSRAMLFPINIGDPIVDKELTYVDVLMGRVDYTQEGAERYTTPQIKLWKLNDESGWRIDNMKNKQRWDLR